MLWYFFYLIKKFINMKRVILLLALASMFSSNLFAQSRPEGMNYQAVARNLKGEILANQPIALKVALFSTVGSTQTPYFREVHNVVTSPTGVFSLIIGQGTLEFGTFDNVPWSRENIWMEVAIKSKGQANFALISNSKLLAVPYAYHAITAESLTTGGNTTEGIPSQFWTLFGNSGSNATTDMLGTSDSVDIVIVTNNVERMRVIADGNIGIKRSVNIGANLTVDSSVYLNKTSGQTINYGNFTVDRQSASLLSGTLTVDRATQLNSTLGVYGITDLYSRLNVNNQSATKLTGSLTVDGVTDLNNNLNVNGIKPTLLTGTLQVNKDATFKEKVLLDNATHQSTSVSTGALVVNGGLGLGGNLNVGGISAFGGPVRFAAAVSITDPTQSLDTASGALIVRGGVGIGKRLNVGEGTLLGSTLGVSGITKLKDSTQSTTDANGSLVVDGGAGIHKNVNIGGALTTNGAATLKSSLTVTGAGLSTGYIADFKNTSGANGLNITVNAGTPSNANDFITFRNSGNGVVGRIEGEIESNLANNSDYQDAITFKSITAALATADLAIAIAEQIHGGVKVIAAATSVTGCVGLGVCVTAPIPSLIIESGVHLILKIANFVVKTANVATLYADIAVTVQHKKDNLGVTYTSGSADYAEWLLKKDAGETFTAGDVVSMRNGFISKEIDPAGKMMVISLKPIVLGNTPKDGQEAAFEKVAFMGQVPVKVMGKVNIGDYILPSGFNKGFGIGVSPDKMKIEDYSKVIGVAWESSNTEAYGFVNTAVGLNNNDYAAVIAAQETKIKAQETALSEMKSLMSKTHSALDKLVPGFSNAVGGTMVAQTQPALETHDSHSKVTPVVPNHDNIIYYEITPRQTEQMFAMAYKIFKETGEDEAKHPFWGKIKSDPGFKASIIEKMNAEYKKAVHMHKEVNEGTR
jgi:hypothetical protein